MPAIIPSKKEHKKKRVVSPQSANTNSSLIHDLNNAKNIQFNDLRGVLNGEYYIDR